MPHYLQFSVILYTHSLFKLTLHLTFFPSLSFSFSFKDGHGGKEVAIFSKFHFLEELVRSCSFRDGRYQAALSETFLGFFFSLSFSFSLSPLFSYLGLDKLLEDSSFERELGFYRKVRTGLTYIYIYYFYFKLFPTYICQLYIYMSF